MKELTGGLAWCTLMHVAPVAQMDRVSASEAEGPAFESRRVYQVFIVFSTSIGMPSKASLFSYRNVFVSSPNKCGVVFNV